MRISKLLPINRDQSITTMYTKTITTLVFSHFLLSLQVFKIPKLRIEFSKPELLCSNQWSKHVTNIIWKWSKASKHFCNNKFIKIIVHPKQAAVGFEPINPEGFHPFQAHQHTPWGPGQLSRSSFHFCNTYNWGFDFLLQGKPDPFQYLWFMHHKCLNELPSCFCTYIDHLPSINCMISVVYTISYSFCKY